MHSCKEVMAALSDLLEDEVAAQVRRELEEHISACTTCQAIYDSARKTVRIVTESRSFDLPEGLSERLMARIMARARRGRGVSDPPAS